MSPQNIDVVASLSRLQDLTGTQILAAFHSAPRSAMQSGLMPVLSILARPGHEPVFSLTTQAPKSESERCKSEIFCAGYSDVHCTNLSFDITNRLHDVYSVMVLVGDALLSGQDHMLISSPAFDQIVRLGSSNPSVLAAARGLVQSVLDAIPRGNITPRQATSLVTIFGRIEKIRAGLDPDADRWPPRTRELIERVLAAIPGPQHYQHIPQAVILLNMLMDAKRCLVPSARTMSNVAPTIAPIQNLLLAAEEARGFVLPDRATLHAAARIESQWLIATSIPPDASIPLPQLRHCSRTELDDVTARYAELTSENPLKALSLQVYRPYLPPVRIGLTHSIISPTRLEHTPGANQGFYVQFGPTLNQMIDLVSAPAVSIVWESPSLRDLLYQYTTSQKGRRNNFAAACLERARTHLFAVRNILGNGYALSEDKEFRWHAFVCALGALHSAECLFLEKRIEPLQQLPLPAYFRQVKLPKTPHEVKHLLFNNISASLKLVRTMHLAVCASLKHYTPVDHSGWEQYLQSAGPQEILASSQGLTDILRSQSLTIPQTGQFDNTFDMSPHSARNVWPEGWVDSHGTLARPTLPDFRL